VVLVGGSTRIPKVRALLERFFGKPPNVKINPDEAVAYGAAVQAAIMSGARGADATTDLLLLDVTSLTLGIELTGGVMGSIIPRNTVIPTMKRKVYTTGEDNQVAVTNKVFEGERSLSKDNRLLGAFELSGFPPMPKGKAQIEVTFDVDANGLLSVTAKETISGMAASITVKNDDRLSQEQIERMVQEAAEASEEDRLAVERLEARGRLEEYVYQVRKLLRDPQARGAMPEDEVEAVQEAVARVDEWVDDFEDSASREEFEERLTALTDAVGQRLQPYWNEMGGAPEAPEDFDNLDAHDEL